ncbi:MAG: hypothetical protein KJ950_01900 [Proteobacteria bacterium]|nr:hypothetical protein [Pseudomonadota bacterium]MBU1688253.1 hypothetical protein [Pseudomonadota bacterium]
MKLSCEKYRQEVGSDNPVCEHPTEYCQFRKACIINFMSRDRVREARRDVEDSTDAVDQHESLSSGK